MPCSLPASIRRLAVALGLGAAMIIPAGGAAAFPERPIQLMVGFPPGGNIDIAARLAAPFLERHLGGGAQVVVVNKPGANGVIMLNDLAAARPDGHTIGLMTFPGLVTAIHDSRPRYTTDSFSFLGMFTDEPYTLYVGTQQPIRTVQELIERARTAPGAVTVAGAGVGSAVHLSAVLIERAAGVKFTWAPFVGQAQAQAAIQGGHVIAGISSVSGTVRLHREGQIRVIGIMQRERWGVAPDIMTMREGGVAVDSSAARGIGGPRGIPEAVAARYEEAVRRMVADPEFQAIARRDFVVARFMDRAEMGALVAEQNRTYGEMWRTAPWR